VAEEATIMKEEVAEEATIMKEDKTETSIRREELPMIETCKSKTRGMIEMTMNPIKSLESKEEADPITKEVAVEAITKRPLTTIPEWTHWIFELCLLKALSHRIRNRRDLNKYCQLSFINMKCDYLTGHLFRSI